MHRLMLVTGIQAPAPTTQPTTQPDASAVAIITDQAPRRRQPANHPTPESGFALTSRNQITTSPTIES
jgi:hypothetical protein